jgi:DNA-binding MarR family transcriptional regulator
MLQRYLWLSQGLRDNREKLLYITQLGGAISFEAIPLMDKLGKHVVGKLNKEEIARLMASLKALDAFHNPYFMQRRVQELV